MRTRELGERAAKEDGHPWHEGLALQLHGDTHRNSTNTNQRKAAARNVQDLGGQGVRMQNERMHL
jgi:hypothetical protein